MDDFNFNKLPDDLKEKVRQSRQAYSLATAISNNLADKFTICNLQVAATAQGAVVISGLVDNEEDKNNIAAFITQSGKAQSLTNNIAVITTNEPVSVTVNSIPNTLTSLQELQALFVRNQGDNLTYSLTGQGDARLILLLNSIRALGIYLRFDGDSGYTTYNPKGNQDSKQDFILVNGQVDEYGEDMLVDIKTALDMMRYYLLTGQMHPSVFWREE